MPTEGVDITAENFEAPQMMKGAGHDILFQLREAAASPSPLTELLVDPTTIELSKLKKQQRNGGLSGSGSRKVPSIAKLALVEEERQIGRLKALLRAAADQLEHEIRRADEAEVRAFYAEMHERETGAKLVISEKAKSQAESEQLRYISECQRYQIELQIVERSLQQTKMDLRRAERSNEECEETKIQVEELNGRIQKQLLNYKIREERILQGHEIELENSYDEGWEEGKEEGYQIGYEAGRKAARKQALDTIDKLLDQEIGARQKNRVERWLETLESPRG